MYYFSENLLYIFLLFGVIYTMERIMQRKCNKLPALVEP